MLRSILSLGLLLVASLTPECLAQSQLEVAAVRVDRLDGAKGLLSVGETVLVENADTLKLQPAVMVRVTSEAANVEIEISDRDRRRVPFETLASDGKTSVYLVTEPGKYWVDVTAIDFAKNLYKRSTGNIIEVPKASPVGPIAPDLPEPVASLKALVEPIRTKLSGDMVKAAAVSAMSYGFADATRATAVPDVSTFVKVHVAALNSLKLPTGIMIGSDIDAAIVSHVGIQRNEQRQWLDRPLTQADRDKMAEVYEAIGWAAGNAK